MGVSPGASPRAPWYEALVLPRASFGTTSYAHLLQALVRGFMSPGASRGANLRASPRVSSCMRGVSHRVSPAVMAL